MRNVVVEGDSAAALCTRVVWIRDDIHPDGWERKAGEI